MNIYYRIVEVDKEGDYKTLFHGINKTRKLPIGRWIRADLKMVDDGGTKYLSGFHVLKNRKDCAQYLSRFTANRHLKIVPCLCQNLRPKEHSNSPVFLAEYMKIIE